MRVRVVVADTVFNTIDEQLPQERGPNGEPSAADFIGTDLTRIVEEFAERWDDLPPRFDGLENIRVLISAGRLVNAYVVVGLYLPDHTIELVEIGLDP